MKYDVSQQRLDLLRRIQAQDQQALGLLYDQLAPLVHTLILRILGEPTDAEDVLLETFWQIWHGAASYDPLRGTVEGWVITLARSRALDHLRAHKRRALAATASPSAHSPCQPSPATTLEDCVLQGERAPAVRAALAALPAEQRADIRSESFWPAVSGPTLLQAPLPSGKASIESAMVTKEFQLHHAYLAYAVRHYPRLAPPHLDLYRAFLDTHIQRRD